MVKSGQLRCKPPLPRSNVAKMMLAAVEWAMLVAIAAPCTPKRWKPEMAEDKSII